MPTPWVESIEGLAAVVQAATAIVIAIFAVLSFLMTRMYIAETRRLTVETARLANLQEADSRAGARERGVTPLVSGLLKIGTTDDKSTLQGSFDEWQSTWLANQHLVVDQALHRQCTRFAKMFYYVKSRESSLTRPLKRLREAADIVRIDLQAYEATGNAVVTQALPQSESEIQAWFSREGTYA